MDLNIINFIYMSSLNLKKLFHLKKDKAPSKMSYKKKGAEILKEIYASTELNRVLNWQLDRGFRMECCFLIDGTVKFILYLNDSLHREVVWGKIVNGKLSKNLSPDHIVYDWLEKYYE